MLHRHLVLALVATAIALSGLAVVACSTGNGNGDDTGVSSDDGNETETDATAPELVEYGYEVCAEYPHDPEAFTQGLLFVGDRLFEATGQRGFSDLREVDLETGAVLREVDLDESMFGLSFTQEPFGEGLAAVGDRLIQLTWRSQYAFVWERDTFEPIEALEYETEGWGLTYDGSRLIMSDGTDQLVFRDPATFDRLGQVTVTDDRGAVDDLNELEYIDGEVWANVWQTDVIVIIDPETGSVTGRIDLSGLIERIDGFTPGDPGDDVLNGIAQRPGSDCILVAGKRWPSMFEIRLVPE